MEGELEIVVLDANARSTLMRLMEEGEYPHTFVLNRNFKPTKTTLRALAVVLCMVKRVVCLTGEVTRRTWRSVSRVLLTVVQYRREGLDVDLRTINFTISERREKRYARHLDNLSVAGIHKIWCITPYTE